MQPPRPRVQLVFVTLLALVTLGALVRTPPGFGSAWARGDDLTLAVAWAVAVGASAWIFVATGACVIALGCARPRLARRIAPALPVAIRRMVEVAIVGSCIVVPALPAHAVRPVPISVTIPADQPVVRAPEALPPHETTVTTRVPPEPTPLPAPAPVGEHVVVHAGENLWVIARAALTRLSGRPVSEAEVARYWHTVIAANRSTLRSGDPSLIFPGELIALPSRTAVS